MGYQTHVGKFFKPGPATTSDDKPTLRSAIGHLAESAVPALNQTYANPGLQIPNHEYLVMGYSPIYMSRNRVRAWDQPSFTIQAGARHAPIHPSAPKMKQVAKDKFEFEPGYEYRRVTVREAACIQTFPPGHVFIYENVTDGYKMIGNAVPVEFARQLALKIRTDLRGFKRKAPPIAKGSVLHFDEVVNE